GVLGGRRQVAGGPSPRRHQRQPRGDIRVHPGRGDGPRSPRRGGARFRPPRKHRHRPRGDPLGPCASSSSGQARWGTSSSSAAPWLAEAVGALGGDPSVTPPTMEAIAAVSQRAREWLDRLPRTSLAIHPGSGSARKNWPRERFAALVDALAAGRPWLLAEGPA